MRELTREGLLQGESPRELSWGPVTKADYIIGSVISIEFTQYGVNSLVRVSAKEGQSAGQPLVAGEIYNVWGPQMSLNPQLDIQPKDNIGIFFVRTHRGEKILKVLVVPNLKARKKRELNKTALDMWIRAERIKRRADWPSDDPRPKVFAGMDGEEVDAEPAIS